MILEEILAHKQGEVALAKARLPQGEIEARARTAGPVRPFLVKRRGATQIVAEVKRMSPSKGVIREDFDPAAIARAYAEAGASAISVLTDEKYFGGANAHLAAVREAAPGVPALRKEFLIDPYQVFESRALGADAALLIAAALGEGQFKELHALAEELGMAALVEVHDEADLRKALAVRPRFVGVNNRDLRTFRVDVETTVRLLPAIPSACVVVAESGIEDRAQIERLEAAGVDAFLIGESLMRERDIGAKLRALRGAA